MSQPNRIGSLIDAYWRVRERKRKYETEVNNCDAELATLEEKIKHALDDQKLDQARGGKATASIRESIVPQMVKPEDDPKAWDKFYAFLHRRKAYHLLERRLSITGCREFMEKGIDIPGVVPFKKRTLHVLTLKTAKE